MYRTSFLPLGLFFLSVATVSRNNEKLFKLKLCSISLNEQHSFEGKQLTTVFNVAKRNLGKV